MIKRLICLGIVLCLLECGCSKNSTALSNRESSPSTENGLSSISISSDPLGTIPSEELIKEVYEDFFWVANAPYPESFDENEQNLCMLEFAFDRYRKGFNGKTIDDFPVYDEKMGIHEAPAEDIINCLSAYFDGIDCEKAVRSWNDYYDAEKNTVKNTAGIGGGHCYIVMRNMDYDSESGVLTTEVCQFTHGVPDDSVPIDAVDDIDEKLRTLIDSGFDDYESYIFKVQFFADDHWRYLSYEKQ